MDIYDIGIGLGYIQKAGNQFRLDMIQQQEAELRRKQLERESQALEQGKYTTEALKRESERQKRVDLAEQEIRDEYNRQYEMAEDKGVDVLIKPSQKMALGGFRSLDPTISDEEARRAAYKETTGQLPAEPPSKYITKFIKGTGIKPDINIIARDVYRKHGLLEKSISYEQNIIAQNKLADDRLQNDLKSLVEIAKSKEARKFYIANPSLLKMSIPYASQLGFLPDHLNNLTDKSSYVRFEFPEQNKVVIGFKGDDDEVKHWQVFDKDKSEIVEDKIKETYETTKARIQAEKEGITKEEKLKELYNITKDKINILVSKYSMLKGKEIPSIDPNNVMASMAVILTTMRESGLSKEDKKKFTDAYDVIWDDLQKGTRKIELGFSPYFKENENIKTIDELTKFDDSWSTATENEIRKLAQEARKSGLTKEGAERYILQRLHNLKKKPPTQ